MKFFLVFSVGRAQQPPEINRNDFHSTDDLRTKLPRQLQQHQRLPIEEPRPRQFVSAARVPEVVDVGAVRPPQMEQV